MITWLTLRAVIGIWMMMGFIVLFINHEQNIETFIDNWNSFGFIKGMAVTIITLDAAYGLILLATIIPAFIAWFFFGV